MSLTVLAILLFALCLVPLFVAASPLVRGRRAKKFALFCNLVGCVLVVLSCLVLSVSATEVAVEAGAETAGGAPEISLGAGLGMLGAALVTGLSCIGAGIAVSTSASAAIGAISENPGAFGKALIFVALAEGVALYGMLISIQILGKI